MTPRTIRSHRSVVTAIERLLLVDDDLELLRALRGVLEPRARHVEQCTTAADACRKVEAWRPDLVLLDVRLPDGTAVQVLENCAHCSPAPVVIGMSGGASPPETFRLAQLGVREFLPKPLDLAEVEACVERVLGRAPTTEPQVRNSVGRVGLKELESTVRHVMVEEALNRSGGSISAAARLLGITRQALQNLIKRER